jgi:hypothetical protein
MKFHLPLWLHAFCQMRLYFSCISLICENKRQTTNTKRWITCCGNIQSFWLLASNLISHVLEKGLSGIILEHGKTKNKKS